MNISGAGTVVFGAANSYSGGTTINSGTLRANSTSTNSGLVDVNSGATLGGSGEIRGNTITVHAGATITAGVDANTAGTFKTDNEAWQSGGTLLAKISDDKCHVARHGQRQWQRSVR